MNNNRNGIGEQRQPTKQGNTYGQSEKNGQRRARPEVLSEGRRSAAPRTYTPGKNSGKKISRELDWVPIFTVLIFIMIAIGIFFTVTNSRAKKINAGINGDNITEAPILETEDVGEDENAPDGSIRVSYAVPTKDTVELGGSIKSDYAILIDLSSNTIKAEKNPDATIFPASMTKVMTLIVAYENCKDPNDKFTVTAEVTDPAYIAGASSAGFSIGETVTIRDLFYGAILPSGADATDALAIYTAGSVEAFVKMMNDKAHEMGLSNTKFANTSGLHDKDHYSTVHEMAMILQYAMKIEGCRKILTSYQYRTSSTSYHPDGIVLISTMFSRMYGDESGVAEIIAGKTGYTNEGLHCLASYAEIKGEGDYVLVTAHAPEKMDPTNDCINIYKKIFG